MEIRFCCNVCRRRLRLPQSVSLITQMFSRARHASTQNPGQANALGDYYESLLFQPLPSVTSATHHPMAPSALTSHPKTDKEAVLAKARVVFGSRLAGPAQRRSEMEKNSILIAGVWVPPRPEEPDNCCMSGCVNCVWDRYRDEMEEWVAASRAADSNLQKEKGLGREQSQRKKAGAGLTLREGEKGAQHNIISMDDDGGGSGTNWGMDPDTDLFKGVPVGILEFMKLEKSLKQKHAREGTVGSHTTQLSDKDSSGNQSLP